MIVQVEDSDSENFKLRRLFASRAIAKQNRTSKSYVVLGIFR